MTPTTIWKYEEVGHNQEGRQELKKIFDGRGYFDGPKPQRLLERIFTVANLNANSIILDFSLDLLLLLKQLCIII